MLDMHEMHMRGMVIVNGDDDVPVRAHRSGVPPVPVSRVDFSGIDPFLVINWLMDQVIALTKDVAALQGQSSYIPISNLRNSKYATTDYERERLERILAREFEPVRPPAHAHRSGIPPMSEKTSDDLIEALRQQGYL